jgi:hypothetical protein
MVRRRPINRRDRLIPGLTVRSHPEAAHVATVLGSRDTESRHAAHMSDFDFPAEASRVPPHSLQAARTSPLIPPREVTGTRSLQGMTSLTPAERLHCLDTQSAHSGAPRPWRPRTDVQSQEAEVTMVVARGMATLSATVVAAEAPNSRSSLTAYLSASRFGYCSVAQSRRWQTQARGQTRRKAGPS